MDKNSKIYVAGHKGLVGSAIVKNLRSKGYENIITRTHGELDLMDQKAVYEFFEKEKPEYVVLAAAKVGGIVANSTYRADFIYENLQIQNNVIHQSYVHKVKKLLFLGSTCIYPKNAPQPMSEDVLLTSPLEYTNEPYAIAKIAGMKMCESYNLQYGTNFISVMPTNLYGPNDNFDLETSHVLPALIRKIHLAKLLSEEKFDEVVKDIKANVSPLRIAPFKEDYLYFNASEANLELLKEFTHILSQANELVNFTVINEIATLNDDFSSLNDTQMQFLMELINLNNLVVGAISCASLAGDGKEINEQTKRAFQRLKIKLG